MSDTWQPPTPDDGQQSARPQHPLPPRSEWEGHGWQMQPPPPQSGTEGFSIAAIILGLVPVCGGVLGIVFGGIALSRIKRTGQGGRGLALTGVIAGSLWLVLIAVAIAVGAFEEADRDATGSVSSAGSLSAEELRVGDCVSALPDGEVLDVDVEPCSQSHVGEVFHVFVLDDGKYPGDLVVQRRVESACQGELNGYLGLRSGVDPGYGFSYLHPTRGSWFLDKGAACILIHEDEHEMTGPVAGSGFAPGSSPSAVPDLKPGQVRGPLGLASLKAGHCVLEVPDGVVSTLDVVPCSGLHEGEVFSTYDMASGGYPGDTQTNRLVEGHCAKWLPPFTRAPAGSTGYDVIYYSPSRASWGSGDRRAICILVDPDGAQLRGEAQFAGRHA